MGVEEKMRGGEDDPKHIILKAIFVFGVYGVVLLLLLGFAITFSDIMRIGVVKDFIYQQIWHALGLACVIFFYIFRFMDYYFRRADRFIHWMYPRKFDHIFNCHYCGSELMESWLVCPVCEMKPDKEDKENGTKKEFR